YRALPTFFVVLASRAADARTLSLHDALPICGISPPSGRSHTGTGPGFTTFGIIMGTLSLLLLQRFGEHVTVLGAVVGVATVSGALLGVRWIVELLLAPGSGRLADR